MYRGRVYYGCANYLLSFILAWAAYWSPIFQSLTAQCINPCREIRHHAISTLQRSLLSIKLVASDDREWMAIFDEVLFPLVLRLLKPEVYHSDPVGMSETRVQAATLVCKIFLRYLDQLPNQSGMLDLWLKILDILDRMMNSGQGDSLVCLIFQNSADHSISDYSCTRTGRSNPRERQEYPPRHGRWRFVGPTIPGPQQGKDLGRDPKTPRAVLTRIVFGDIPGRLIVNAG